MDIEKISEIKEYLNKFWEEQAISLDLDSTSIDNLVAAMDSPTAVEALIDIEDIVGMELPTGDVVRQGGYKSREEFIEELTRSIVKYVEDQES